MDTGKTLIHLRHDFRQKEAGENEDIPLGEAKMMEAVQMMESEMKNVNEDDPKHMVSILRKLSKTLG